MSDDKVRACDSIDLRLRFSDSLRQGTLEIATWGIRAGRYGSLGHVSIPVEFAHEINDVEGLARVVLAALYGLDYDL